jgi:hypothetical protein
VVVTGIGVATESPKQADDQSSPFGLIAPPRIELGVRLVEQRRAQLLTAVDMENLGQQPEQVGWHHRAVPHFDLRLEPLDQNRCSTRIIAKLFAGRDLS